MEKRIETVKKVSIDFDIFTARLKECMKKKGYKKADLARITAITPVTIGHYVNGERKPRGLEDIATIAKALDTSLDYLMGISDTEKPASSEFTLSNYEDAYRLIKQLVTRFKPFSYEAITETGDAYGENVGLTLEITIKDETLCNFFEKEERIIQLWDVLAEGRMTLLLNDLYAEMRKVSLPQSDKFPWED